MLTEVCVRRNSVLLILAAICLAMMPAVPDAGATGFAPNVRPGSDIVMHDMRWPAWDKGTYYCFWYMRFVPKEVYGGAFYGGVATKGPESMPGMFMSHWGRPTNIHEGEYFYAHGYGAEGASGGAHGKAVFLRIGAWYRFVMRMYPPTKDADKKTCVGWWVKDVEKNRWYTHSIVSLPGHLTGFQGNSGFVEALAPESIHRAFERRFDYCRLNGKWYSSNKVSTSASSQFKLIENDTVLRFDRPVKNDAETVESIPYFTTKQPDTPPLDKPNIEQAEASVWENQVAVRWNIPKSAAPQLGYKLEVFDNTAAQGDPLDVFEDNAPHILARRLDTQREAKSVRLTVRDIFDQKKTITIPVQEAALLPAAQAGRVRPGLEYAYYETPENAEWERLPDFSALRPVRQGRVGALDDTVQKDRYKLFALRYTGYLRAPADGLYVFSAGTCDGSRIVLDGNVIADNDGIHSASVKQYSIALKKGLHAFEMSYFKGPSRRHGPHANLADKISVSWEGPGFGLRKLTKNDFVSKSADLPSLALHLKGAVSGGVLEDNLAEIRAKVSLHGHRLTNVQLYSGRMLLKNAGGADLGDTGDIVFNVLFPVGGNRVWARLWYDDNHSVDSDNMLDFEAQEYTEGPWKFIVLGHKYPIGARYKDGTASFAGEGFYVAYQKVSGDYTLTARIAEIALTTKNNGVHPANWLGLYTSNVGQQREGKGLESTFNEWGFGVYLTAGRGMKGSADFPDLAGTRMCMSSFPEDHRWLRIIRRGKRYQSFTSADGKTWQKATERISKNFSDEQYAGVCFRAVPGKGRGLFQGAIDNMKLARGKVPEEVRGKPRKQDLSLKNRITALLQARQDPEILYARSPGKGLFKSKDRGETWKVINGGLSSPDALAVRSVVVHPKNSSVILRAGGSVVGGVLKSGLWKSTNGGKSWKLVTRDIDFDGRGPTTIFGEVISFCLEDPNLVAAGGETNGVFVSRDAGATWEYAGLKGERVTCLAFSPKTTTLIVGTFADKEFETLGLGTPVSPIKAPGRIYRVGLTDAKKGFSKACELEDFGVLNIGGGAHPNFSTFATTRGVYYTWQRDNAFSQRRYDVPADMPFTALGYRYFNKKMGDGATRERIATYAAPFSGKGKSPVYCVPERTTGRWSILSENAQIKGQGNALDLNAGISCILPDKDDGDTLYLCNRHGIFKSVDGGENYKFVFTPDSPVNQR